ncbi:MAG: hypothetical protein E8D41_09975 [Nitrospira sp.]|nr:MAG: hypothetical protein E8D41_09975 [Nitrospira sp.]
MRSTKNISQNDYLLPPRPIDVLDCWRWYDKAAAGDALPEKYKTFEQRTASSKALQNMCTNPDYELKWRHALRSQLGAMWVQFDPQYPPLTVKKPSKGRPAHYDGDFTFNLCVFNTIILKLLGESDAQRQQSRHWAVTAKLLRKFFPGQCRESDGWTSARVKARVNGYLRTHLDAAESIRKRPDLGEYWHAFGSRKIAAVVEARAASMERLIDFIDSELKDRRTPPKPKGPGPTAIVLKF